MKTLKLLAFLLLISVFGISQTHTFCPLDGNCTWTGAQADSALHTFNLGFNSTNTATTDFVDRNVIEQGLNPAADNTAFQAGQTTELFSLSSNSKNLGGSQQAIYGSWSHFGSGSQVAGFGGAFEGFNDGPGTATLIGGVSGTANCGGVAAGVPVQTPTNNGNCTNLRAGSFVFKNLSSGNVANGAAVYIGTPINSGGGSITSPIGLQIADQNIGTGPFAIKSGVGKVQFGDTLNVVNHGTLPAATSTTLFVGGSYGSPILGKIYVGDGSGWQLNFSKRTGSTDTELFQFKDNGNLVLAGSITSAAGAVANVVASGTSTFTTTAVGAGACQTTVTTAATGALTSDTISWAYASAPTAATDGVLHIQPYVTANNVNFMRCNPTAGSITPTALVINWRVIR